MKRRKTVGRWPNTDVLKAAHVAKAPTVPADIVRATMQEAARKEIADRICARKRPAVRKTPSKQPPRSDEMKDVTEIGSRRWKSGQTK